MTNGNDGAFARGGRLYQKDSDQYPVKGLTKREYFAAMAMQGGLACNDEAPPEIHARLAIRCADALIEALNAPQEAKW